MMIRGNETGPLAATDSQRRTIHTAVAALLGLLALASSGVRAGAQQKPKDGTQVSVIKPIIDTIRKREKALKAVLMELGTRGSYPGGKEFRTQGSLRVLGSTHFHIKVESTFGGDDGIRSSLEKVITPAGVWTHQHGPLENHVYTHMDQDLMQRLRVAERALAAERETAMRNPGPFAGNGEAPLGSAMLEALDLQFELAVEQQTRMLGDQECRVVAGRWRGSKSLPSAPSQAVHRVEVFLRKSDGIPIRVVQYNHGESIDKESVAFEMQISKLVLDPPMTEASFVLKIPEGVQPIPVRDHRPSRAQIDRILQEYAALQADRKDKPGKAPK